MENIMSDNVYSVNPGLKGLIPKPDKDTTERTERQIIDEHVKTVLAAPPMESIVVADDPPMTLGEAYRLGAAVERDNLSEAIDEYLELGTPDHDLRSLTSFLEWHLGPVS